MRIREHITRSKIHADEPSYSITDVRPLAFATLVCLLPFIAPLGMICFQVIIMSAVSARIVDARSVVNTVG